MAYDSTKPAGTDTVAASDTTIRANFAQIVANITNQHVWDNSDASKVIHNRASGIITRDTEDVGAPTNVDETISIPHAFNPTLVVFDWDYLNGTAVEVCRGFGYHDGTDDKCNYHYVQTADTTSWTSVTNASACIYLRDDGSNHQVATCTLGTNKFTLAWTKTASPTGIAYIRYTAFG